MTKSNEIRLSRLLDVKDKHVHCRVDGCECNSFQYIPGHGTFWPKCACHHTHEEHRSNGVMGGCQHVGCTCESFYSPFACACGYLWEDHKTTVETLQERRASGRPVDKLVGGEGTEAACGAITNFTSLLPGVDREDHEGSNALLGRNHLRALPLLATV